MYLLFSVLSFLYIALHLVSVFVATPYLWGVDAWRYYSVWLGILFAALGLSVFIPGVRRAIRKPLVSVYTVLSRMPLPVLILLSGGLLYLLRQRTFFLGDGRLRMVSAEIGVLFEVAEPLDTLLHGLAYRLLHPAFGFSGKDVYQYVSIAAGMFAVGMSAYYLRRLYNDRAERWIAGSLLGTSGAVQLFFGYAESYTVSAALILAFLLSTLVMIRTRKYSVIPVMFISLAAAFHPQSVMLFPGAVYGYLSVLRDIDTTGNGTTAKQWFLPWGIVLGTACAVAVVFYAGGKPVDEFFSHYLEGGNLLPLVRRDDLYGILSPGHLFDILNELWLIVPAIAGLVFMAGRDAWAFLRGKSIVFLMISSAGLLAFTALFHPRLGFARDWDLFAVTAFPLTLLAAEAVIRIRAKERYRVVLTLVMLSCVHTVPWLGVNASESMSIARFESIVDNPKWSIHARELAFNDLALFYHSNERYDNYFTWAEKGFRLRKNMKYFGFLASNYYKHNMIDKLFSLTEYAGTNPEGWFYVGFVYEDRGEFNKALETYDRVLSLDPDFPGIHLQRGQLFIRMNRLAEAIPELENGLARSDSLAGNPVFQRIGFKLHTLQNNLGLCYLQAGRTDDAIRRFKLALMGHEDYHQAQYYLAASYYKAGKDSLAIRHARLAEKYGHDRDAVSTLLKIIAGNK